MATARSVVLNGEPGSGKSTVSRRLARRLGIRRISVGEVYREMAQQRGMSALELNLHAELDNEIDHYADKLQSGIAARERLAERSESERVRFLERYGDDKTRLRNYDLVCDSTRAEPEEIVARIIEALAGTAPLGGPPRLNIDPRRIHPTIEQGTGAGPIRLGFARPHFFVVDGHREVDSAARDGHTLVLADLVAEANEPIDGCSAKTYYATHTRPTPG